jgi:hypothetical protein
VGPTFGATNSYLIGKCHVGPTDRKKPEAEKEKQKAAPVFTKNENTMIAQRIEILNWHHKQAKPSQKKTAAHFDPIYPNLRIKQPLLSSWLKDESMWRERWAEAQAKGQTRDAKRLKQVEHPEIDKMMELWIAKAMRDR